MKKILILLLFLLLLGCQDKSAEHSNVSEVMMIKSITQKSYSFVGETKTLTKENYMLYDALGNRISETIDYILEGHTVYWQHLNQFRDGKLVGVIVLKDDEITNETKLTYDGENVIKTEILFDGELTFQIDTEYDGLNKVEYRKNIFSDSIDKHVTTVNTDGTKSVYVTSQKGDALFEFNSRFNKDDKIIESLETKDGVLVKRTIFEYSEGNKKVISTVTDNYGNSNKSEVITDDYGNEISNKKYDENGEVGSQELYEFKYDAYGNWLEMIHIKNGFPLTVEEKIIEYHN